MFPGGSWSLKVQVAAPPGGMGCRGAGGQGKRSVKGDGKDFGLSYLQNAVTIY